MMLQNLSTSFTFPYVQAVKYTPTTFWALAFGLSTDESISSLAYEFEIF